MQVAEELASEVQVLALDEFFVTDVADAVTLNRLFRCGRHDHASFIHPAQTLLHPVATYSCSLQELPTWRA